MSDPYDSLAALDQVNLQLIEENKTLKRMIGDAQIHVCSLLCPSVKKADEEWTHCKLCEEMTEALNG